MGFRSSLLIALPLSTMSLPVFAATTVHSSIVGTEPYVTQGVEVQQGSSWYLGTHADHHVLKARMDGNGVRYTQHRSRNGARVQLLAESVMPARKSKPHPKPSLQQRARRLQHQIDYEIKYLPPLPQAHCRYFYYRVLNGDSLSLIAKHVLQHADDWQLIYNSNKKLIGKNPSTIEVGQVLRIPEKRN